MQLTDDKMREDIRRAVADLEKSSEGEMVCVIAGSSARYVLFPLLWAGFAALTLPLVNAVLEIAGKQAFVTFSLQGLVFLALAILFSLPVLRARVTPRRLRESICQRAASEQFYAREMYKTKNGTGILLYVSVAERYVGFLGDAGIRARVKDAEWAPIIDAAISDLRRGHIREGYLAAIRGAKEILIRHFPEKRAPVNELTDHLIEMPESPVIS
jgi:putative membrane protein